MEHQAMRARALAVGERFQAYERAVYGRPWSLSDLTLGLVGDVGDLAKLVQAREGVRAMDDLAPKLAHELADVLWSVIVIAERCGVDLEAAFLSTMEDLERQLAQASTEPSE